MRCLLLLLGCFALCAGRSHVGAPFRRGARAVWALRGGSGERTAHSAEDGQTYYFNAVTGESSWELPPGASVPSGGAADFLGGWSAHTRRQSHTCAGSNVQRGGHY